MIEAHDLHVWALSPEQGVMSAHLEVATDADREAIMSELRQRLERQFDLRHSTIQLDCPDDCQPCNDDA